MIGAAFAAAIVFGLGLVGHTGNRSLALFALPGGLLVLRAAREPGRSRLPSLLVVGIVLVALAAFAASGAIGGP